MKDPHIYKGGSSVVFRMVPNKTRGPRAVMIKRVQKVINPSSCMNSCTIYTLGWAFTTPKTTQKRVWTQYHVLILSRCKNHFQGYIVATIPQGERGRSDPLLERHRNATACPGGFKTTKVTKGWLEKIRASKRLKNVPRRCDQWFEGIGFNTSGNWGENRLVKNKGS